MKNKNFKKITAALVLLIMTMVLVVACTDLADEVEAAEEPIIVLSVAPGFHDEAFDLIVSVPSLPNAVIYYTIDGNEPQPGDDRFITRRENDIQVSGRLPESGIIRVEDRTANWRDTMLTSYQTTRFRGRNARSRVRPATAARILQGTAFRFRAFVDGEPVTETVTATYIIAPNAGERFAHTPIVSITAPYDEFIYIYEHASRDDPIVRRRTFTYEYFEYGSNGYDLIFNMPGSTSLGGSQSRDTSQRTLNVHLSRGELDGSITHPILENVPVLYRFRLHNGSQGFMWDFMRDAFSQRASADLNLLWSDSRLVIKFINGEFWGFTHIREHTSNRHFVRTHTGIASRNIAILNMENNHRAEDSDDRTVIMEVTDGPEDIVYAFFEELAEFVTSADMSTDYNRERLFNEFFCQENFMDYLIARTFFAHTDWPFNNIRLFRAIEPDLESENPYNDGRWRFILHDMAFAPNPTRPAYNINRFSRVYSAESIGVEEPCVIAFRHVFLVMNNPTFAEEFRERALYVLDTSFQRDALLALQSEFVAMYEPLLPEMYNRWAVVENVADSIANFHYYREHLTTFLTNRDGHYRRHLDRLIERLEITPQETEVPAG